MKIAVIPARGGSKRVPRKNIRPFAGKPMIAWSIEAAFASGCFDEIIVSTDDAEIADVARGAGASVPFVRPAELSNDHAGTVPVIKHAVEWAIENGRDVETACCIYATAPFISPADISMASNSLLGSGCDYVFPVTTYAFPIQRAIKINSAKRVEMFDTRYYAVRSQDLEHAYHDCGQFYWGRRDAWLSETPIFSTNAMPIIVPRYRVQDIDTLEDWAYAELLFELLERRGLREAGSGT